MIIIREIFTCKPGQASKFARLMLDIMKEFYPNEKIRIMTDVVGPFNTVVMETQANNLAEIDQRIASYKYNTAMHERMKNYTEMYMTGSREVFQTFE